MCVVASQVREIDQPARKNPAARPLGGTIRDVDVVHDTGGLLEGNERRGGERDTDMESVFFARTEGQKQTPKTSELS